jgi:spermidine synthase
MKTNPQGGDGLPATHTAATAVLFFTSGFAGLVYEVLWMKELGLLFGNTAHAAATTLAAFFLGLVTGARYWGRRADRVRRPLRAYAVLEAGVALSAVLYFFLLDAYYVIYSALFRLFGGEPAVFLVVKLILAVGVLMLPSFFMGGTLPMMSQHLVRRADSLGRTASALYAVNTLGAALGAYVAGFHLPRHLGFTSSYLVAIALTGLVAALAWALGSRTASRGDVDAPRPAATASSDHGLPPLPRQGVWALAFFSGLGTLSLEVLWTRMFAQVLQNSVYTFSTILVTFLVALAVGATLASGLIRRGHEPVGVLLVLLGLSGLAVGATPFVFHWLTEGLTYFGGDRSFEGYVLASFAGVSAVILLPAVLVGSLFPYLLRLAEPSARSAGRTVGDLAAINTVGAVVGALGAGFFLLDGVGLWASLRLIASAYLCAALLVAGASRRGSLAPPVFLVAGLLLLGSLLDPTRLPIVKVEPVEKGESLLRVWESSSGVVSVIRQPTSLRIKLDNDYSLGGTGAARDEEAQAHLPLLLHPEPRSVFFLGMGTGITAGAALRHPVERVVVSELSATVVEAARTFFKPHVHGLFEDPRVRVVAEDGRNYLLGAPETFDLVIADLFMPWKAGVGGLYSREHFQAARQRLRPGGLYVQWLPLYQLSRRELGVVARTMREVFPLVTLWRGATTPGQETVALFGHQGTHPLPREAVARRLEVSGSVVLGERLGEVPDASASAASGLGLRDLLPQYCGNLTSAPGLLEIYPVNTDDRPVIEYEAPVAHRRARAGKTPWFVGRELLGFLDQLMTASPPETDPYLKTLAAPEIGVVRGGLSLHRARVLRAAGDEEGAWEAMREFERRYGAAGPAGNGPGSEAHQTRRELTDLIETYQRRIDALREHLREAEEEAGASPTAGGSPREPGS